MPRKNDFLKNDHGILSPVDFCTDHPTGTVSSQITESLLIEKLWVEAADIDNIYILKELRRDTETDLDDKIWMVWNC